jgi:hypothetical protein
MSAASYAAESREMNADSKPNRSSAAAGLCANCTHSRQIESARGSTFWLCQLSVSDARFPKYPRLPVLSCLGYKPSDDGQGTAVS